MNIFSRSWQGQNLSPGERAFVKLVEGWLFTAIGIGIAVAYQLLATGSQDYQKIFLVAGGAAALSVLNAVKKYLAAQSDLPLPVASLASAATNAAIQKVQEVTPPVPMPVPQPQFVQMAPPVTTAQPAPQFVQPFPYAPSSTYPNMPAVQP